MIHLGDITKLKGNEIPVVDVICGGSPCQDLSVAGTRSGLDGERSGLFMEQVRIIKEMRKKDAEDGRAAELIRPRWMVWENVTGALSSSAKGQPKGADFQRVLTEIVRIAEPDAPDVPMPDKGWPKAGCIYDELGGWSIAWRVTDAQFFGLAQRRRRIALVADFAGLQASEVIFDPQYRRKAEAQEPKKAVRDTGRESERQVLSESESVYGDSEQGSEKGEGASDSSEGSTGEPVDDPQIKALSFQERAGKPGGGKGILIQDEHTGALVGQNVQSVVAYGISPYASNAMLSDNPHSGIYEADTSRTLDLNGGTPSCNQGGIAIVTVNKQMHLTENDIASTLEATDYKEPIAVYPVEGNGQRESHRGDGYGKNGDPSFTLNSTEHHGVAVTAAGFKPRQSASARTLGYEDEIAPTLSTDENYATVIREDDASI